MAGLFIRSFAVVGISAAAACATVPADNLTFQEMQAQQAAIQSVLNDGTPGAQRTWLGPGDAEGLASLRGEPDDEGCRLVETSGPGRTQMDRWCPTPHGFWVHPDELFYRNATGQETYGGSARSRDEESGARPTETYDRLQQIDCLRVLREERRLADDGRDAAARNLRRAFRQCLHRSD